MSRVRVVRLNILIFSPFFPPGHSPEAIVTGKLALAFLDRGYSVSVISSEHRPSDPSHLWWPLRAVTTEIAFERGFELVMKRLWSSVMTGYPVTGTTWGYRALREARKLIQSKTFDVIMTRSHPIYGHLPGLILSRQTGIPWIANWNDPDPPVRAPKPYGDGRYAAIGFWWERFMRRASQYAAWHTFPSERLMDYMLNIYPLMRGKSSVIPHIALTRLTRKRVDNGGKFIICHAGSIASPRDPNPFFEGFSRFLATVERPDSVQLLFLGVPEGRTKTVNIPQRVRTVLRFCAQCSYEASLELMSTADVLLVIEPPLNESIFLLTKFVDSAQCAKPILNVAPVLSTGSDLLLRFGGGITADCTSPDAIFNALRILYETWCSETIRERFNSEALLQSFSDEVVVNSYRAIFKWLPDRRGRKDR